MKKRENRKILKSIKRKPVFHDS